jgi:hypothetical protein
MTTWPVIRGALFSADRGEGARKHRVRLTRIWGGGQNVMFLAFKPGLADDFRDDEQTEIMMADAKRWGFGGMQVGCIATLVDSMRPGHTKADLITRWNDSHLCFMALNSTYVIPAYGGMAHPALEGEAARIKAMFATNTSAIYKTAKDFC